MQSPDTLKTAHDFEHAPTPHFLATFTNAGHARLAANLIASTVRAGIDDLLTVYVCDSWASDALSKYVRVADSAAVLIESSAEQVWRDDPESSGPKDWGTAEFGQVAEQKLRLLLSLSLEPNWHPFVFCDADTAIVNDPFEALRKCAEPLAMQNDNEHGHAPRNERFEFGTGVIVFNQPEVALMQCALSWLINRLGVATGIDGSLYVDDQRAVSAALEYLCRKPGVLDAKLFPNGALPWTREACIVHANWVRGRSAKEARLRAADCWFVREDHLRECGL